MLSKPFRVSTYGNYYDYAFEWFQMIIYYLLIIHAAAVITAAYRKAAIKEMGFQSKYEQMISESIEVLSVKTNKFIKEIIRVFVKEKKKNRGNVEKKNEEMIDSEELLDDFSVMDPYEKRGEKILIVYEIHNTYLEEINRYKEKKENSSKN